MPPSDERILERLEAMVAAGRVTEAEAARLRAAHGTDDFGPALAAIRARHAKLHADAAVSAGRLTQDEADDAVGRVQAGEHSSELRARIKRGR